MDANRHQFPVGLLLTARSLRAFADGYVAVLLPVYLLTLGLGTLEVGVLSTVTMLGSAAATLAVGRWGHRFELRRLLVAAAALMALTGIGFAAFSSLWPLLIVALAGTMNPGGGDVSVFYPLEHTALAAAAPPESRTTAFARYSFIGSMFGAIGALAAAAPEWLAGRHGLAMLDALKLMFVAYGVIGVTVGFIYSRVPAAPAEAVRPSVPLGPSRATVWKLAGLFSIDSFAGGFLINAMLALWLFERFELSLTAAGAFFFWTGLLSAVSQLAAAPLARRIGLVNTMVFTHLPANVFCVLAALMPTLPLAVLFLCLRAALSSMDVPARTSYVMAVVSPAERPAAASLAAVPRSLAAAVSPAFAGYLLTLTSFGWPLVICGALKIVYDLTLLAMFRKVKPPEER